MAEQLSYTAFCRIARTSVRYVKQRAELVADQCPEAAAEARRLADEYAAFIEDEIKRRRPPEPMLDEATRHQSRRR